MEGRMSQRKHVYSFEPNHNILGDTFGPKYVQHLVPALRHINKKKKNDSDELRETVKYEVDMALALSTGDLGFAWSHALRNHLDENRLAVRSRARFSRNVSIKSKNRLKNLEFKCSKFSEEAKEIEEGDEIAQQIGETQLSSLRKLLPGGNEMDEEELVREVASYIVCLEQQVQILQCIVQTHDP